MYCIVDIETTGNGIEGNRITEISIFKYDGATIVDEFTSLVNPQCQIPYYITGLTGIDNDMVATAPLLSEIAEDIIAITEGCIFVAHSVNFDYNVIKNELKQLGIDFVRKKLCTVRLSRKLIPGLHSYSLGKLCSALQIPLTDRHRARGDAHATVLLFEMLLQKEGAAEVFKTFLNARSQEATLPPHLPQEIFSKLPQKPGIYYFKNKTGSIIYVGKAINIKKRVLGHFYDKKNKEILMCQETAHVDFELAGSELVALLMESSAIKHHFPLYNRAQKRTIQQYGIFCYEDRNGIKHLAYNKLKAAPNAFMKFSKPTDCLLFLEEMCRNHELCPKYCHLQENVSSCSHFRIGKCGGICRGEEDIKAYNAKVVEAIKSIQYAEENLVIKEKGRHTGEDAIILIQNGQYSGYGFIDKEASFSPQSIAHIEAFVTPQKNTVETQAIIRSYLNKYPQNVFALD